MEDRKGIELLELSYNHEFKDEDRVCLYIRSTINEFNARVIHYLSTKGKGIHVLEKLSRQSLVIAYQVADVFVLPTHGEGWGRPIMEAMAAGVPVITTFWSGQTEFLTPDTAILIQVETLEAAYRREPWFIGGKEFQQKHQWAHVSIWKIARHLRWAYDHQGQELQDFGDRARDAMFAFFTREKVAERVKLTLLSAMMRIL